MNKQPPPLDFDENPEWTDEDFARAKVASTDALVRKRGRPAGSDKERIAIRVDRDVLARFKADGPGWQSRMNSALRKVVGL